MRVWPFLLALLTFPMPASAGAAKDEVTTDLVLSIDSVQSLATWVGPVMVVHFDARFVLSGTVTWVQRPSVIAQGSDQAFAIHSPAKLGLTNWKMGDAICLQLTRIRRGDETSWRMSPLKPDAGCAGAGRKY